MPIEKIISGAQTGADRAGLDAAIELGIPYGGYITKGRRSEDGTVPERYTSLVELDTWDYPTRTEKNLTESDATLLFTIKGLTGGSALTAKLAAEHEKLLLRVNLDRDGKHVAVEKIQEWLQLNPGIRVLNVAGSRESKEPGFGQRVKEILLLALEVNSGQ